MNTPLRPWQAAIRSMLADPEFCFPIASAQVQYRDRYYGMSAAALLEDLFFDSVFFYTKKNAPDLIPHRPPRGEKGYDYEMGGERISHKVGKRATPIAVLWDATRHISTWTAPNPLIYHSFDAEGRRRSASFGKHEFSVHALSGVNDTKQISRTALVVRWQSAGDAEVLQMFEVSELKMVREMMSFTSVWSVIRGVENIPANEIDILLANSRDVEDAGITVGAQVHVSAETRPGIYLLDPEVLRDIELTRNNRGQLIPARTVNSVMDEAIASGRFLPLPTWFSIYAADQPPSLYVAQKSQFDDLFS